LESAVTSDLPLTASDAAAGLRAGVYTSVELTAAFLARADTVEPELGSYVTRFDDAALARARQADEWRSRGFDTGMYQGVPVGVKDVLAVAQGPTKANSRILDPAWGSGRQGPAVSRLERAGAVILGKQTTFEFATGYPDPGKTSALPRNPWDLRRTPGGSSAGTASGIAAGLVLAGLGTDTGGSIRIPAAWCGITGMKPTYGLVPKSGCVPLAYSLDHVGPLARSARDCAGLLAIIAGYDASDTACVDRPVDDYLGDLTGDLSGITIGVVRERHFPPGADPALGDLFDRALKVLKCLGAELVEVTLPLYEEVNWALWTMLTSEALAYHRNDLAARWLDYHELTRMNIVQGTLNSGADYVQSARIRRAAQRALSAVYSEVDLVVGPTIATAAPAIGATYEPKLTTRSDTIFTGYWNAVGNPALAIPMGFSDQGLPLSLQLAGRPFEDAMVLRAGDAYQRLTDWHRQRPPESQQSPRAVAPAPTPVAPAPTPAGTGAPGGSVVPDLLARAGLDPLEQEREVIEVVYANYRAGVDPLYAVPDIQYCDPAITFRAADADVDW
jgi:aspartyl-tRNA(Asn)/glutamyl-tRNA(Gln) amidotransferase subunit A